MTPAAAEREHRLHRFFEISLVVKAVFALGEIVAAVGACRSTESRFVGAITRAELAAQPSDPLAGYLADWAQHLSASTKHFLALFLLSHGAVKLWVIIGLLRERLWYYPVALVVFGVFILYQMHRFSVTHSVWLLIITLIDVVVIALTWHEYSYLRGLARRTP